jgi:ankyrin repeat protein
MRNACRISVVVAVALVVGAVPGAFGQAASADDDPCVVALKRLHGALKKYVDTMGEMPRDLGELVVLGFVDDPLDLVSPRSIAARAPAGLVADRTNWRVVGTKFEGWVLVSDEVRDRTVYALHADGRVGRFLVATEMWYGHWEVPEEEKWDEGNPNEHLVPGLELYLQEVPTSVARPAVFIGSFRRDDAISNELRSNDRLLNVGGHQVTTLAELQEFVRAHPEVRWTEVPVLVMREQDSKREILEIGLEMPIDRHPPAPDALYPRAERASAAAGTGGAAGEEDRPRRGGTPTPELVESANRGKIDEVRAFIREGADVDSRDDRGFTALIMAVYKGHVDVVKELLDAGADPNAVGPRNETPLLASVDGEHPELFRLLLEKGAKKEYRDDEGGTILAAACNKGNLEMIRVALDAGIDVNVKRCYREGRSFDATPLMIAASMGRVPAVTFLLSKGADADFVGQEGWTALMIAAAEGEDEVVPILLAAGADPNRKNDAGKTALALAREQERKRVVEVLEAVTDQ